MLTLLLTLAACEKPSDLSDTASVDTAEDTGGADDGGSDDGGSDDGGADDGGTDDGSSDGGDDTGGGGELPEEPDWPEAEGCRAAYGPADRERTVVVSFPYAASGAQANTWRAYTLTADGALVEGDSFEMGRGYSGQVAFTPDGSLGLAAQDDGSVGIFSVGEHGEIGVVEAAYDPGFYAVAVAADPSGEAAWVVDGNWAENGGGIYRFPLDCETGAPGAAERVLEAKLPIGWLSTRLRLDRWALAAWEVPGADASAEAHLFEAGEAPALLGSGEAFGDDEALLSAAALTFDDGLLLIADYSPWSGIDNRVAAVPLAGDAPGDAQVIDVYDPVGIAPSPFNDLILVLSGYGDAVESLYYTPGAAAPLSAGPTAARPALPTAVAQIWRGPQRGLVLVTENQGVWGLRFEGGGEVSDLGLLVSGSGLEDIAGAIGAQP
jgi:hypothetical protein